MVEHKNIERNENVCRIYTYMKRALKNNTLKETWKISFCHLFMYDSYLL